MPSGELSRESYRDLRDAVSTAAGADFELASAASSNGRQGSMGELRGKSQRHPLEPAVAPYLYQALYELAVYGPLTAGEFTMSRRQHGTPRGTANSLRGLVRLGLVERADDGIYSLTPRAWYWLVWTDPAAAAAEAFG